MMYERSRRQGGQAIVLFTVALMAMMGMLGLAVDLGWSFFVEKQAQAAADGAAMAAVKEGLRRASATSTPFNSLTCNGGGVNQLYCTNGNPTPCSSISSPSNLYAACKYAEANGFTSGGSSGRQTVTVAANLGAPPTGEGLSANNVKYWVTVRATQTVPQLFSAVLGNSQGLVASRASGALVAATAPVSLYALNREGDCVDRDPVDCGINIKFEQNGGGFNAAGGIVLGSNCTSVVIANQCTGYTGRGGTNTSVTAPTPIVIRGGGTVQNPSTYHPGTVSTGGGGGLFYDPTRGLPQPPIAAGAPIPTCGIQNGTISTSSALVLGPFNYYAYSTTNSQQNKPNASGAEIKIDTSGNGSVTFATNGTCPGILSSTGATSQVGNAFPVYLFHGGMNIGGSSSSTRVTFGPGQYVFDGNYHTSSDENAKSFVVNGSSTQITTSGAAGQMFIFTAPTGSNNTGYPGLDAQVNYLSSQTATTGVRFDTTTAGWYQGKHQIQPSSMNASTTLNGLNTSGGGVPDSLQPYNGVLFWQDRRNTKIKYTSDGTYNCAPYVTGGSSTCVKTTSEIAADRVTPGLQSPEMELGGTLHLNGVSYQPRGAWVEFQGPGATMNVGGLQVLSGTIYSEATTMVNLSLPTNPITQISASLVE
ncbi:MAG: pilus assembly protein TadG-related protein [Bryobacteraceae bacterium]